MIARDHFYCFVTFLYFSSLKNLILQVNLWRYKYCVSNRIHSVLQNLFVYLYHNSPTESEIEKIGPRIEGLQLFGHRWCC